MSKNDLLPTQQDFVSDRIRDAIAGKLCEKGGEKMKKALDALESLKKAVKTTCKD